MNVFNAQVPPTLISPTPESAVRGVEPPLRAGRSSVPRRLVLALGLMAGSASSFAATTVYQSSATFLSALEPGAYTENFSSVSYFPANPSSFSGGAFSYSLSAPRGLYGFGQFVGTNLPGDPLTITFDSGNVYAVGANFFATNQSNIFRSVTMTITLSDHTTVTFKPTSVANSYRGFTSDLAISSLTISVPSGSSYAGLDNLTVGIATPVPEPATVALMLAGLGVVGGAAARRRKRDRQDTVVA